MIYKLAGLFLVLVCGDMGVKQYIEDSFQEKEERETLIPFVGHCAKCITGAFFWTP